jgi:hypothetical protein
VIERMTTRMIAASLALMALLGGCTPGPADPGALTAAATATEAAAATGADRVRRTTYRAIDTPWGDGQRTATFHSYVFNYVPLQPAKPADDTVTGLQITHTGEVTVSYAGIYKANVRAELTTDERKTFARLSEKVTFEYRTCPRTPGEPQPYYIWQVQGTNHEFRPLCPPDPTGMTAVLLPNVATDLSAFVQGLARRLINRTI